MQVTLAPDPPLPLRARIDAARAQMGDALRAGVGGRRACRALSDAYDDAVAGLWSRAVASQPADEIASLALVATGGWGRREMSPFSDIDFILLCPDAGDHVDCTAARVADSLLYPLWDAGFRVGHAVRDPQAAARLARDDLSTATALLDARLVAGDEAPFLALARATRREIAPGGNANAFVNRLATERTRRHDRFGDSLYLLEPNLKQGIGGLRDLATALWAVKARWSIDEIGALVGAGQISARQAGVLEGALDFLLALRGLLQLHAGRATDQLTFEIQEAIAPRLEPDAAASDGVRPAVAPAVEALMRRFYLHARGVVRVTERLLEAARVPARRRPRIGRVDGSFLTFNGKLSMTDPQLLRDHPAEMLRLFRVALDLDVPIYGHTRELVEDNVAQFGDRLTGDPTAARHFLDALTDLRDDRQPSLLEGMHQVGLLSAVMPEFAPCTCRVQHDLYHVYTVDQHQLMAVAMLKRLARGELASEYPHATAAAAQVTRPAALFLGLLLHDVGKPMGKGHAEKGAQLAERIARRLGLPDDDVALTAFLVRQHLTMSHLSQRRDLSDPDVIARFARRVGSRERLDCLYLCTMCDTAMTAPGNLTAWKNKLLVELHRRTAEHLAGAARVEPDPQDAVRLARERAVELLAQDPDADREREDIARWVDTLDERFLLAVSRRQLARQAKLAWAWERGEHAVDIAVSHYPLKGHSELAVVADDVSGLLASIAGVLAANRIDVLGAIIGGRRREPGARAVALDLFYVRDAYTDDPAAATRDADRDARWDRVRDDLRSMIGGDRAHSTRAGILLAKRRRPSVLSQRVTPGVPTEIRIHNDASADATVVEVFTQNRPGVLYAITYTLSALALDIHMSMVGTEGEKVADVFYVTRDDPPRKITDPDALAELEDRLLAALREVDPA